MDTMKTLKDVRMYAERCGLSDKTVEKIIDYIESDGNGNIDDSVWDEVCEEILFIADGGEA